MSNCLECSTKGDKRFSALYAKVSVNGVTRTIEDHYQFCKEFLDLSGNFVTAKTYKEAKHWQHQGRKALRMKINGTVYPIDFLGYYYKSLWVKYFNQNPDLMAYASRFDEFTDQFQTAATLNCQADIIRQLVQEGKRKVLADCKPLLAAMRGEFVQEVRGDLLEAKEYIIGHQTNCIAKMGAGLAKSIKMKYPLAFDEYEYLCNKHERSRLLMGECQIVIIDQTRAVANLFGQFETGTNQKRTEEEFVRQALVSLKEQAMANGWSVALPYQMGSNLGGAVWADILQIIQEVFCDYPVTIYNKIK